jgi:hypothetical protein
MSCTFRFLYRSTTGLLVLALLIAAGCSSEPKRAARSMSDMMIARKLDDAQRAAETRALGDRLLAHVKAEQDASAGNAGAATTRPTVDILIISGGGDWGAFGAGVLKGWGRAPAESRRPEFDIVTGVSTGALIAPFAYLGDDQSIERIVTLYRNPRKDWAKPRGALYFWPTNPSFYALPGLEREVRQAVDVAMLQRIVAANASGRALIVNTTNVDLGDMHAWDIPAEARRSLDAGDGGAHVRKVLLASAGVPAAFPSRVIGESLYVDGAITGNILYGGRTREEASFWTRWKQQYPDAPTPTFRYWVIFNNQLRFPPQVTQPRWPAIVSRATVMATQTATVNAMRHLFAIAELARLKHDANIEVRVMSVPDDWVPPNPRVFDKQVMNDLADIGERMGADPANWRTTSP